MYKAVVSRGLGRSTGLTWSPPSGSCYLSPCGKCSEGEIQVRGWAQSGGRLGSSVCEAASWKVPWREPGAHGVWQGVRGPERGRTGHGSGTARVSAALGEARPRPSAGRSLFAVELPQFWDNVT